jgi:isopenicillin N synthase-like dioxygenase
MTLVPVIDLQASSAAADIDRACTAVGFMQVVGHDVPAAVIGEMATTTAEFFSLPDDTKRRYVPPRPEVNRGYAARGTEALSYSVGVARPPDLFEAFNIGPDAPDLTDSAVAAERHRLFAPNLWPDEVPGLRSALVAYMAEVRRVADVLTGLFAVALGLADEFFAAFTRHSTDTLRVNHYRTSPGDPDPAGQQLGMGEHTDYGIVTVLYAESVPGLQILGPDGDWHDVVPRPGALLVNLGDLTAQWTNDRWRSTLHRVLPPGRQPGRTVTRRSVAFFHDGDWDAVIECLPTCHDDAHPPKYAPVTAGDHLMGKLLGPRTLRASVAADTTGGRLSPT